MISCFPELVPNTPESCILPPHFFGGSYAHVKGISSHGHSVSSPSVAKIADFPLYLRQEKHLSVPSIKDYHSTLVSFFKFRLPELQDSFILHDLIRSFEIEYPHRPVGPPSWDLVCVLDFMYGSSFEPLRSQLLRVATMKTVFLVNIATAKKVSELQALSCHVALCVGTHLCLTFQNLSP